MVSLAGSLGAPRDNNHRCVPTSQVRARSRAACIHQFMHAPLDAQVVGQVMWLVCVGCYRNMLDTVKCTCVAFVSLSFVAFGSKAFKCGYFMSICCGLCVSGGCRRARAGLSPYRRVMGQRESAIRATLLPDAGHEDHEYGEFHTEEII